MLGPLYRREDGVSCEACHGAGEGYSDFSIMYDRGKSIKKGMIADPKATCIACHDSKAHEMPAFDYDRDWMKIQHPIPGRHVSR
jgi:nitrate/TMAO reductase-like tetraheme cytochrome c subunit